MTCITYNPVASAYQLACNVDMTRIGQTIEVRGSVAPRGSIIEDGSCISQTTYAALFSVISTTYGSCSAGLFKLPFSNGTGFYAFDNQGVSSAANRITTATCANPNAPALCGTETKTLGTSNLPPYTPSGTNATAAGSVLFTTAQVFASTSSAQAVTTVRQPKFGARYYSRQGFSRNRQADKARRFSALNPMLPGIRAIKY